MVHKCPLCGKESESGLAAERKLAALIEAGEQLRHGIGAQLAWDRAVAEVK